MYFLVSRISHVEKKTEKGFRVVNMWRGIYLHYVNFRASCQDKIASY